ncbi:MAG: hypothetical protein H7839_04215 [Magnetococcus sp. YQC-5]
MHTKSPQRLAGKKRPQQTETSSLSSLSCMAKLVLLSKRWHSHLLRGGLRGLRSGRLTTFVRGTRRCPDGQQPHPSVCLRGWRGDVCHGCVDFRY